MVLTVTVDAAHEPQQRVVVGLAQRIELVVVAARAADGQAQERRAGGDHDVIEIIELRDHRAVRFVVPDVQAVKAGGDQRLPQRGRHLRRLCEFVLDQFVAGKLLLDEAVVGLVRVEGVNDVVAVTPRVRLRTIALVAVAFGVADEV